MWPLNRIVPYPNNPRTHPPEQITIIADNMKSVGVTMPILVDEGGVIIAGHGRRLAAEAAGFTEYPVVIARGWSEKDKRATRLADNAYGLMSGWDAKLIAGEIGYLKTEGYNIPLLGFPEMQLRGWGITVGTESAVDPEATPEPPKNPVSKRGDLWVLGDHRSLCGDATSESDVAACLGDARPHLMVTDPPYGVDYDPDWRNRADRANGKPYGARAIGLVSNDNRIDWREAWSLFSGNVAYVWHAGRHASLVDQSLQAAGFEVAWQIIWAKTRLIIGRGDYHLQHEPCWYTVRKGEKHHWNGDRSQTTLWTIPHAKSETGHSTQKPIECMKRPIENNSKIGDSVYEPFSGSGTTIIAGEMTKRKVLAIEILPAYVDVAALRWQTFTGKAAVLESTGQTFEEVKAEREKKRGHRQRASVRSPKPSGRLSEHRVDGPTDA